jgi:hypothetical protein
MCSLPRPSQARFVAEPCIRQGHLFFFLLGDSFFDSATIETGATIDEVSHPRCQEETDLGETQGLGGEKRREQGLGGEKRREQGLGGEKRREQGLGGEKRREQGLGGEKRREQGLGGEKRREQGLGGEKRRT